MLEQNLLPGNLLKISPSGQNFEMLIPSERAYQYIDQVYEPLTGRILSSYILENSTFVDLYAGVGYFSLLARLQSKAQKVISIEPDPVNFEILSQNVKLNHLQNVVLYSGGWGSNSETEIRFVQLTEFLLAEKSDTALFLNINVAGDELMLLTRIRQIVEQRLPKIRLVVAYNPKLILKKGHEPGNLLNLLFSLGFDILGIDEIAGVVFKVDANRSLSVLDELGESTHLLCLPKQALTSVLLFSHSSDIYGSERSLQTLISTFPQDGIVPTVVLPFDGPLKQQLEENGAITLVQPFGWWSDQNLLAPDDIKARLVKDYCTVQETLLPNINRINPDVIITNTSVIPWGSICAFLINKPHLWYVRELGVPEHGIYYFYPREVIADYIKGGSNLVITNSFYTRKFFFGESMELRAEVIYPIVELNTNTKPSSHSSSQFFHHPESLKLASLGVIRTGKGQLDAINALRSLKALGENVEIVFAGNYEIDPDYYKMLTNMVEECKLASVVHFVGVLEDPHPLFEQADVILICSRNEAFGRVTLEAMSLGKPIIAAESGGTSELIENDVNGLLYHPGNYSQLSMQIKRMIYEPEYRLVLGRQAAEKARKSFSRDIALTRLYKIFHTVVGEGNHSSQDFVYWVMKLMGEYYNIKLSERDAQIAERDAQIAERDAQIAERDAQIAERDAQIAERDIRLAEHYSSQAWKLALRVRQIRILFFPEGSLHSSFFFALYFSFRKLIKWRHRKSEIALISLSEFWDKEWYVRHYPEVISSGYEPIEHFLRFGGEQSYDPGPKFSSQAYLHAYPDVDKREFNPLVHYLLIGQKEGRIVYPSTLKENGKNKAWNP